MLTCELGNIIAAEMREKRTTTELPLEFVNTTSPFYLQTTEESFNEIAESACSPLFHYLFRNTTICSFVIVPALAPLLFVGEFREGITLLMIFLSIV